MSSQRNETERQWEAVAYKALSGLSAGMISCFVLHPLELIKTRQAVDQSVRPMSDFGRFRTMVRDIYSKEGVRGFYRAAGPNVIYSSASWGIYFGLYNGLKLQVQDGDPRVQLNLLEETLTCSTAGVTAVLLYNPLNVVKTRLMLQRLHDNQTQVYRGFIDGLRQIYRVEGFRGYYKGLVPAMVVASQGTLQLIMYEQLRKEYCARYRHPIEVKMPIAETLAFSVATKVIANFATYPYTVCRTRMMDRNQHYTGAFDCIMKTWRGEGARGFYKGITPNLIHVVPNICIVMMVYEQFPKF